MPKSKNYVFLWRTDDGIEEVARLVNGKFSGKGAAWIEELLRSMGWPDRVDDPKRLLWNSSRLGCMKLEEYETDEGKD